MDNLNFNCTVRSVPPEVTHKETSGFMRRQLARSVRNDRKQWWMGRCRKTEQTATDGNNYNIYRLIRNTGPQKPSLSKMTGKSDGTLIHPEQRRMSRWEEHVRKQFSWPTATPGNPFMSASESLQVDTSPSSEMEIAREICFLKKLKATSPDGLSSFPFRDGGGVLSSKLKKLLESL